MRITVKLDSATPQQVYNATCAYQRTVQAYGLPSQITTEPTVTVCGTAMGWESPALDAHHAPALLVTFERLEAEDKALQARLKEEEELGYPLGTDFN